VRAGHRRAFAKSARGYTHQLVDIDKFFTNLRAEQGVTFFTDIVYRFGVPNFVITDNGFQFTAENS
jgi:hypothetical protein